MVRQTGSIVIAIALTMIMSFSQVFADGETVELSSENTTVMNRLPEVIMYCETTEPYDTEVQVEIDGYPAEVTSAQAFKDSGEGMDYYVLVDISTSMSEGDFKRIKSAMNSFASSQLDDKDRIWLIPFGERVYIDQFPEGFSPGSGEFANAMNGLKADDDYTNLYDAIDAVAGKIRQVNSTDMKRSAVVVFTDGMDETTGGFKNEEEAPEALKKQGIPLYSFALGKKMESKDKLGVLSRELGGRIYTGDLDSDLQSLKNSIDNTLVIRTEAMNAADLGADFDVTAHISGQEQSIVKKGVVSNRTGEEKNSAGYTFKKIIKNYWWLIAIVAIALIALFVLMRIRRHRGIVKVDGETVFRDNLTQKQHISVAKKPVIKLRMTLSVDGSNQVTRDVDLSGSIIVGRSNACDLYFDDPAMARQNFCIEEEEGRLHIRDLESTNGTILNGIKLTSPQELHKGDVIIAGKTKLIINW